MEAAKVLYRRVYSECVASTTHNPIDEIGFRLGVGFSVLAVSGQLLAVATIDASPAVHYPVV
jgi:hypothetical protein